MPSGCARGAAGGSKERTGAGGGRPPGNPVWNGVLPMKKVNLLAVLVLGLALVASAQAQQPASTTITIPNMHCAGCAKKVVSQLAAVPGVAAVQPYLQAKKVVVTSRARQVVSPRALWEAVEKADKTPTRLEGPAGTFTAKPQS